MIVVMFEVKPISEKTNRKFDPVNAHYSADSRDGQRWAFKVTFLSRQRDERTVISSGHLAHQCSKFSCRVIRDESDGMNTGSPFSGYQVRIEIDQCIDHRIIRPPRILIPKYINRYAVLL